MGYSISAKIDADTKLLYRENTRGINISELNKIEAIRPSELKSRINISFPKLEYKEGNWYLYNDEYYYLKERSCISYILMNS